MIGLGSNENQKGFSLVEILVALALFTMFIGGVALLASDSYRATRNAQMRIRAISYIRETINAVILNKDNSWLNIVDASDGLEKHLEFSSGVYDFVDGSVSQDGITISILFNPVYRDANGNIVETGGTEDAHSRQVLVEASWLDVFGSPVAMNSVFYINDWNTAQLVDTTVADFTLGSHDLTYITDNAGGEVELETMSYGDWCNPNLSLSSADLPGSGIAQSLWAVPGEVFAGTGQNASGLSYINLLVDESDPPVVTVEGTLDGYKTNNVYGEDDYGYIVTDTNAKEMVIMDLTSVPLQEIGFADLPGALDGDAVVVSEDIAYITASTTLFAYDLTSRSGERSLLGSVEIAGKGRNLTVRDGMAFVAVGSVASQLQIVDVSDPALMQVVGQAQVNGGLGVDLYVTEDTATVYLATESSSGQSEVFIVDVEVKTGDRPTLNTYETTDMNPNGIVVIEDDERMIVVGSGGEEYQVVDISDEQNLEYCGGLNVNNAVHDVVSVVNSKDEAFSYIVTGDSGDEFKMIKGGQGGGGAGGEGHVESGNYVSRVFDTESLETYYYYLEWDESIQAGVSLSIQLRSGDTSDLSAIPWVGPDGTSATYFTQASGSSVPAILNNHRYIQYRALMTSDTINTPVLEALKISYQ